MKKLRFILITVLVCALILGTALPSSAEGGLIAPSWVSAKDNDDGTGSVIISTPVYMLDAIDLYEYSIDGGKTWITPPGDEIVITETCEFSLRYISGGQTSEIYSFTVTVSKFTEVSDVGTGITLRIPRGSSLPKDVTLSAYEIIQGNDYTAVSKAVSSKNLMLFNVLTLLGGEVYNSDEEKTWLFPVRDFDAQYCKLYYVNGGKVTEIDFTYEENALCCVTTFTGMFALVEDKANRPGDVNGDGSVTSADARLALRASAKLLTLTEKQKRAADVDGNGVITSADARKILRASARLEEL